MIHAIFDVFREEIGEFLEEAELTIYNRHFRDLSHYLDHFVQTSVWDAEMIHHVFRIANEIGYQLAIRNAPHCVLQQFGERLRAKMTDAYLQMEFPPLEPFELHRRLMHVSSAIADYTNHIVLGYHQSQADELLNVTERKYKVILDALPVTVVVYDKHERCVFANKTTFQGAKLKEEQVIGKNRHELTSRYHKSKEPEGCWERVLAGERVKFKLEDYTDDGIELNEKEMIPLLDTAGRLNAIITVNYPAVSEKERLYHLQKQFSFVLNSMNSGLLILNRDSSVTGFNKKAESIFGVEAETVLGESLFELLEFKIGENVQAIEYLKSVMEDGRPIRSLEHSLTIKERTLKLRLDGNAIKNAHGVSVGYILIIDDLTELVTMREAMIRNEKFALIGQFAAGIAHEIRNPLTTVFGFLQLYAKGSVKPDNFSELTNTLLIPEIDRANTILSDFLMVSKPQAPSRSWVDTNSFVADVVRWVESEAHLRGIELKVEAAEDLPRLYLDVQQMKQVFLNLCKNGFDVTPPGGCLTLRVLMEEQAVRFDVIDEGPGIEMRDLARIFEPFYTTKEHGTGLGLPISHRIVEGHGGTLQVRSTEGIGTTFMITVPMAE